MDETIEHAAIRLPGGEVLAVPRPRRHHHVFELLASRGITSVHGETQGFLTSTGRFVDRYEAFVIAKRARQIVDPLARRCVAGRLFSEDVW